MAAGMVTCEVQQCVSRCPEQVCLKIRTPVRCGGGNRPRWCHWHRVPQEFGLRQTRRLTWRARRPASATWGATPSADCCATDDCAGSYVSVQRPRVARFICTYEYDRRSGSCAFASLSGGVCMCMPICTYERTSTPVQYCVCVSWCLPSAQQQ